MSTPAFAIRELSFLVLAIVTFIFVVVASLMVLRNHPLHGSTQIELARTVVPFLIVIVLFLTTTRYIFAIERHQAPPDALETSWWETSGGGRSATLSWGS